MVQSKWVKYWTTPYALTNCVMFGKQYTKSCWEELEIGFSEVNFIIEKRVATVFRIEKEQEKFNKMLGELFSENTIQAKTKINKALIIQNRLYDLFREKSIYNYSFFSKFKKLYNSYLPYFLSIMWAANSLDSNKHKELLKILEQGRKATEKFYTSSEKFLDRYYSYIKQRGKNKSANIYSALTDEELARYLKTKELPVNEVIQKRYSFSLITSRLGMTKVYIGEKARDMIKNKQLEGNVMRGIKTFSGQIAYKGKYLGKVRKVLNHKDVRKFVRGEVLVTAMTRPEWMSGIKLSGAIITDVGGVLCHAAVISRELKKPCIIGTKIATQILKDGMMVEVDANKGEIKILNK